jgi:signal transduction histidine kinase
MAKNQAPFWPSISQSLRRLGVQIIALFLLLGLAIALVFSTGTRYSFGYSWRDLTRPLVSDYVDRLALDLGSPPKIDRAQALASRLPLSIRLSGPVVNWQSESEYSSHQMWPGRALAWRERAGAVQDDPVRPQMLSRRSLDGHLIEFSLNFSTMEQRPHHYFWLSLSVILLLLGLAYWYVRRMLAPLEEIRAGALRFGRGDFSEHIAVRSQNELGSLARDVNIMAKEIQQMLDAKRALLLAMSHELRSPLTRAKVHVELLPDDPVLLAQKAALMLDLNLMRDLIQDLLESEQLGAGHRALYLEETDLVEFARDHLSTLASAGTYVFRGSAVAQSVAIDRTRMRLLIRNLFDNAQRHGASQDAEQVSPEISVEAVGNDRVKLTIRDFGPGVDASELARLAQAFYRVDGSRSRGTGGVGLGLYLCRLVAQAHGAHWTIRNAHPGLEIALIFSKSRPWPR